MLSDNFHCLAVAAQATLHSVTLSSSQGHQHLPTTPMKGWDRVSYCVRAAARSGGKTWVCVCLKLSGAVIKTSGKYNTATTKQLQPLYLRAERELKATKAAPALRQEAAPVHK